MTPEQRAHEFKNKFPNPLEVVEEIIKVLDNFNFVGTLYTDFETGLPFSSDEKDPQDYWEAVKNILNGKV